MPPAGRSQIEAREIPRGNEKMMMMSCPHVQLDCVMGTGNNSCQISYVVFIDASTPMSYRAVIPKHRCMDCRDGDNVCTAPIMADKAILKFVQGSENIEEENEINFAPPVPTLSELRNVMKMPAWHGSTLNSCRATSPLVRLVEGEESCLPRHALLAKDLVTWQAMVGRHILEDIVGRVAQYVGEHYPVDKWHLGDLIAWVAQSALKYRPRICELSKCLEGPLKMIVCPKKLLPTLSHLVKLLYAARQ
ncbi:hypothetical protein TNCV_3256261 [Trichonephila clavipes]|nr:hypothetical protein TNCV_3256261 [Trichonephila clavipes]